MIRFATYSALAAATLTVLVGPVLSEAVPAKALEDAVKARHHVMQLNGYFAGILGAMAKGETPYDSALAVSAATNLHAAAMMDRTTLWIEGSEQGAVTGSRAKMEIWSDSAGFEAKAQAMEAATETLVTAAGTDQAAIQAAMGAVGEACGACHKAYRGPKN